MNRPAAASSAGPAVPPLGGAIVTYFPDADFEARLAAIARETDVLVVVDNSADAGVARRLAALRTPRPFHLFTNATNVGLGAALNQAFTRLVELGCRGAIAFDQDSTPEPGFRAALLASVGTGTAAVGAHWYDEARPDHAARHLQRSPWPLGFRRTVADRDLDAVTCVITSGTWFDLAVWQELGGFAADLFLDLVDTEYCLRAQAAGRTVRVSAGARLRHRRGRKQPVRRAGRTWWPAFMPERRLYYLFRNRVLVGARLGWRRPEWCAFEAVYSLKILAEILFLEDRKIAKLHACLQGTWHGAFGVSGPARH